MQTVGWFIYIIAGIIITLFYKKIGGLNPLWFNSESVNRYQKPPMILRMICGIVIGSMFIVIGIYNLVQLSIFSIIILLTGYYMFRFFKEFGSKLNVILKTKGHIELSIKTTRTLCMLIGIVVVVVGMMNLV